MVSHLSYRPKQRLDLVGYSPVYHVGGEDLVLGLLERTEEFLAVDERREALLLFPKEGPRDPRALCSRDLEPLPDSAMRADPLLVEHTTLAVRCRTV